MILARSEVTGNMEPATVLTGLTPSGKRVYDPMADVDLLNMFDWECGNGFFQDEDFGLAVREMKAKERNKDDRAARVEAHAARVERDIAAGLDKED